MKIDKNMCMRKYFENLTTTDYTRNIAEIKSKKDIDMNSVNHICIECGYSPSLLVEDLINTEVLE